MQSSGLRQAAGVVALAAITLLGLGCSSKGKYAGKLNVVVGDRLKQMGVSVDEWRYSDSEKAFGVKLKTSRPLDKQTYITINISGRGMAGSPIPVGEKVNKNEWMDFGGSVAFGNPFADLPENGTITIDVR